MVETRLIEWRRDQETILATVSGLMDRLEAVAVQMKDLQEQTNKSWEGVQLQLTAIANGMQIQEENGGSKEQTSGGTGGVSQRPTAELRPMLQDRGNPFPKLEFQDFDGSNLEDWVYRSERYFDLEQTAESKKVRIASVYMYGKAMHWHYTFLRNRRRADMPVWTEYVDALTERFGKAERNSEADVIINTGVNGAITKDKNETVDHLGVGDKELAVAEVCVVSDDVSPGVDEVNVEAVGNYVLEDKDMDEEEHEAVVRSSGDSADEDDDAASDDAETDEDFEDEKREAEVGIREKTRLKEMQKLNEQKILEMLDAQHAAIDADMNFQGMGIPVGKLSLYTSLRGLRPSACLPITIDVGTNNEELLNDEFYIGLRRKRARGEEFAGLLDEFRSAVKQNYGEKILIQFEDFANHNAFDLLVKYSSTHLVFNDDFQGTASVVLAGVIAAMKATDGKLADQTLLFLDVGEAGTRIAELIALEMLKQTQESVEETSKKIWLVDSKGLIVSSKMESLQHFKKPWAHEHEPIKTLLDAVNEILPTVLIGTSGRGRTFIEGVKPQPYEQTSGAPRLNQKLTSLFYGPYKILDEMGTIAYSENRKPTTILHWKVVNRGSRTTTKIRTLGCVSMEGEATWEYLFELLQKFLRYTLEDKCVQEGKELLQRKQDTLHASWFCRSEHMVNQGSRVATKFIIQWSDSNEGEATWEFPNDLMQKSSEYTLEDKCGFEGRNLMQVGETTQGSMKVNSGSVAGKCRWAKRTGQEMEERGHEIGRLRRKWATISPY